MADTNFRGPVNSMGSLEVQSGTAATIEPFDGPSGAYQGVTILDPHTLFAKDGLTPGRVPAWVVTSDVVTVDCVPQAAGTAILAAAQVVTAATPMNLATVAVTNYSAGAASIAVGVPFIPYGSNTVTTVIALDFGFTTGTTVASSSTVTVADNSLFTLGQWIVIGNVGNTAATQSLITQVVGISTTATTSITVSPVPATALGVPIGGANLWGSGLIAVGTQFGPQNAAASAVSKTFVAGLARVHNPKEFASRSISVTTGVAGSTGGTAQILVSGYDVYGVPMTELITASGTTSIYTRKAFKYLQSMVPVQSQLGSYSVGIGDNFGFPFRYDEVPQVRVYAGATAVVNSVGFSTASLSPATNTTGDVRGTILLSGQGTGTPITNVATTNNVLRLYISQTPSPYAICNTTPNNLTPMFGTTQV